MLAMSFRWYVILMGMGTGLAWVAWVIVLMTMNPDEAGLTGLLFFYSTLFLSCVGTLALVGILYRVGIRKRSEMITREVRLSFRHAVLLSAVAVIALWLSHNQHMTWYYLGLLGLVTICIEYVFMVIQRSHRQ